MSETKHTPGPWRKIMSPSTRVVAVIKGFDPAHGDEFSIAVATTAADAHLIAAAPDLLQACEQAYNRLGRLAAMGFLTELDVPCVSALEKVINKAKGNGQ